MLQIVIPSTELWDNSREEFVYTKEQTLRLEHSLVSLRKWESKWCKPFLSKEQMSVEETIDYIRCMTITQNVDPFVYNFVTDKNIEEVRQYIEAPMTATWFSEEKNGKPNNEQITAELIYYWMIALGIPSEYEKWHLNSLLTLIKVCNIKNQPPKKMSTKDIISRNKALNAANRKRYNSRG